MTRAVGQGPSPQRPGKRPASRAAGRDARPTPPAPRAKDARRWFVYLVRCRDGSLYAGCTNDLGKRLAAHNAGRGARYTRARRPVTLAYWVGVRGRARALSKEAQLKQLSRAQKLALVAATPVRPTPKA